MAGWRVGVILGNSTLIDAVLKVKKAIWTAECSATSKEAH
jgi:aspartate/methionine/tyrosine aminotransferase